jgi:hypothetical protein
LLEMHEFLVTFDGRFCIVIARAAQREVAIFRQK